MTANLPVLLVVLPLLAAPLSVLLRRPVFVWFVACGATLASAVISAILVAHTQARGGVSYEIGSWPASVGIAYEVDRTNALIALLVSGIGALAMPLATAHGRLFVRKGQCHFFGAAFLLCIAGLLGITVTGDTFNVFVFLEISSLSTYVLISMGGHRRAFTAALNYLILGTIGGTFVLIGIGLLYQVTGTLNMAAIAARVPEHLDDRTLRVAFAFFTAGIGIKVAFFPLHQWLPNAYSEAPPIVDAFVAGTATKVMFYLLLRLVFTVFGVAFVFGTLRFGRLLEAVSLLGAFAGAIAAVFQTRLRRILAYSSISQLGYMTLGMSLGTTAGVTASLIHTFAHGIAKAALFLVVGAIIAVEGSDEVLDGLGKRMPVAAVLVLIGGLSLIGVPGTVGFVSKWYLLMAMVHGERWVAAVAVVISSLIALVYVWRLVEAFYLRPPADGEDRPRLASRTRLLAAAALLGLVVYLGVSSEPLVHAAELAAAQLVSAS